jgi:hypothetical protein
MPNEYPAHHESAEGRDFSQPTERVSSAELDRDWTSEREERVSRGQALLRKLSVGLPARPLLGRLPLARVIPQDVHSVMDYLDGGGVLLGAFVSDCPRAKAASWVLGASGIGASAVTDYRLSLAKLLPIETHEAIDYAFGVSAISAPFLFGYRKTAPLVAAAHIAIGIGTIVASLFTDYRAFSGVGRVSSRRQLDGRT